MKSILKIIFIINLILSASFGEEIEENRDREVSVRKAVDSFGRVEPKDIKTVDSFEQMFSEGKFTGQIRSIYASNSYVQKSETDNYATAIGGMLKYELASFHGFNVGVAVSTSHDLEFATGDEKQGKQNPELSSDKGSYTQISEAYLNYRYKGLNLRAGRQNLNTPLADSDDIRMIQNSFEAYMITYELEKFIFSVGNLQRWQGSDAGLGSNGTKKWVDLDSVWLGGVSYSDMIEFNAWYYDIPTTKAYYFDFGSSYDFTNNLSIHSAIQYLKETESTKSDIQADIYGAIVEFVAYGLGVNIAYNKANRKAGKSSFSGIGGGTIFTSMDTMIIDEITEDREVEALVFGLVYEYNDFNFLYAYGDFKGEANTLGEKANIVEQDIGFEYDLNDKFVLAAIYVKQEDKQNDLKTQNDWQRVQVMVKYDF